MASSSSSRGGRHSGKQRPAMKPVAADASNSSAAGQPQPAVVQGKVVLLNATQFEVQVGYHAGLIQLFKEVPSRSYDPVLRRWSFHARDYDNLMRRLRSTGPGSSASLQREVRVEPLPATIAAILSRQQQQQQQPLPPPPPTPPDVGQLGEVIGRDLAEALLPFQLRGVQFVLAKSGRALLGDDMGLGKTVQAIAVALYYRSEWPALIVTPSSVRYAWRSQLLRWAAPFVREEDILVLDSSRALTDGQGGSSSAKPLTIVSYDLLAKCADQLASRAYRVAIFDESHFLKNAKTARSRAAVRVAGSSSPAGVTKRLLLLSGTPALSRPAELYTQIALLRPRLFAGFHEFGRRYCDPKQHPWGTDYSGSSHMPELRLLLEDALMIRRLKADVLEQLPAKRRQMVVLDPTSLKRRDALSGLASDVVQPGGRSAAERRGLLLEYFHATARVKLPAVKQYVLDLLEESSGDASAAPRKFLMFAHHAEFLDELDRTLTERAVPFVRIDGRTAPEARHSHAERFQTCDEVRVALLSITAAGTGINLTAASLVLFGELFWNPGVLLQAEDRAYRIGQRSSVCVHYLVAQGTADDHLWPLVQRKLAVLGSAGLNRETFKDADTAYLRVADDKQARIDAFFQEMLDEEDANRALFATATATAGGVGEDQAGDGEQQQQPPLAKRYKKSEVKKRKDQLQLETFFVPAAAAAAAPSTAAADADADADAAGVEDLLAGIPDEEWDFDWSAVTQQQQQPK